MKYIKTKSVSFWAAMVPLASGLFIASLPVHGLTDIATSISNAAGMSAPALINIGIAGVGFRAAINA